MSDNEFQRVENCIIEALEKLQKKKLKPWFERPAGIIFIGVATVILASVLSKFIGMVYGSDKDLAVFIQKTDDTFQTINIQLNDLDEELEEHKQLSDKEFDALWNECGQERRYILSSDTSVKKLYYYSDYFQDELISSEK